ncbi:MAG: cytochrome / NADPH-cytochrome reductase [Rubrobacteraceae bacterium]|nr:cytochrome / NADPH-cytochrome reductase [Rubrobacteraceae bacterium]
MEVDAQTTEPIPQSPGYPLIGNLLDLRSADTPLESIMKLARQYGLIFRVQTPQGANIMLSGFDLVDEVSDEERFDKFLRPELGSRTPRRGCQSSRPRTITWSTFGHGASIPLPAVDRPA